MPTIKSVLGNEKFKTPAEKRQAIVAKGACDKVENVKLTGKNFTCKGGVESVKPKESKKPKIGKLPKKGLAAKLGLNHHQSLTIGRASCNADAKLTRAEGDVCVAKNFKPSKGSPHFNKTKSIASVLTARLSSAKANAIAKGYTPMTRKLVIHTGVDGSIPKTINSVVQSRSIYNLSKVKRFGKRQSFVKLGGIVAYKTGSVDAIYGGMVKDKKTGAMRPSKKPQAIKDFMKDQAFANAREALAKAKEVYDALPASDKVKGKGGNAKATWERVSKAELAKIKKNK